MNLPLILILLFSSLIIVILPIIFFCGKQKDNFGHLDSKWIHNDLSNILNKLKNGKRPIQIIELIEEAPEVYSFNCMTPVFCKYLLNTVSDIEKSGKKIRRPNSMNNYGVVLNEVGLRAIMDEIQKLIVQPLSKIIFPGIGDTLNDHHSFTVRYKAGEDKSLDMHTDDSHVTFNLCLGENFTGSTLHFCGNLNSQDHRKHSHTYIHEVGRAVMHLGNRRHGADNIESGVRTNLVMWSYNPHYKKSSQTEKESSNPDLLCLSWTHDRDYKKQIKRLTGKDDPRENSKTAWCPHPGNEYIKPLRI